MTKRNERTLRLAMLGLFTALIIIMSFTPLGYLRTAGVEVTFLVIPVALGAVLLGPANGAILGAIFGITSFIQCFGFSAFGAALLGINPVYTFLLCLVPRVLAGWLSGLLFKAINNGGKRELAACSAACLAAPLINTILFTSMLILFFWNSDFIQSLAGGKNILAFIPFFVGVNGLLEAAACLIIGTAAGKALLAVQKRIK